MEINEIYSINFSTEETIVASTMSKPHEIVMLLSLGDVIRFDLQERKGEKLFSVKNTYSSQKEFDITAETSIYTMDEIVVVVNDFKRYGFVHYPGKYHALQLYRGDSHTDITVYPIGLYKAEGVPYLIFGQDWNHIQIMNLDTRQILTATKSLIEEGVEEAHIEAFKEYEDINKLPWTSCYDYFFGKLYISPDQKYFLSAGWMWGSCDWYNIYDIDLFIKSNRISGMSTGMWEHSDRATCWVDNETIAVLYSPHIDGDEDETASYEIHLYKLDGKSTTLHKEIPIDYKELSCKMYFSKAKSSFVILSKKEGLSIFSLEGETIFKNRDLKNVIEFNPETGLFLVVENVTAIIFEMVDEITVIEL